MSHTGRKGILLAFTGIILAGLGLFTIWQMLQASVAPRPAPTAPAPVTQRVVITSHAVAPGVILKAEDLAQVEVPVDLAPANALTDPSFAAGRITTIPLVAGEMIMGHHLADPTNVNHDLAFVLEDNMVLMAFPASDLLSELNILQRGDQVDILVSLKQPVEPESVTLAGAEEDQEPEEKLFTFNALQRIPIQAIVVEIVDTGRSRSSFSASTAVDAQGTPAPTPVPDPADIEPRALLLALAPQDALILKHVKDAGGVIDIVLRAPTSTQLFEAFPVSPDFLIDRYGLENLR